MPRPTGLLSLGLGLALGAGGAFTLRHVRAPVPDTTAAPSSDSATAAPAIINHPSYLINPPRLAGSEATAALDAYLALPPLPKDSPAAELRERLDRLHALLTLLPDSHLPRLVASLAPRVGDAEARLRLAAFEAWTERDAPAAARWAFALVPGAPIDADLRALYAREAALDWSRADFDAAYAWAGQLAEAKLSHHLLVHLLAELASIDPRRALSLARSGDDALLRSARILIFRAWSERDPAAALRELGPALIAAHEDTLTLQKTLSRWAASEPSAALDWAAAQPAPENNQARSPLHRFAWHLAGTPEAVRPFIDLIHLRTDLPDRAGLLRILFNTWSNTDAQAALAWIDTLPDAAERSDLINASLWQTNFARWESHITLARRLPPGPERDNHIARLLSARAEKSPDEVVAWLARNPAADTALAARQVEAVLVASLAKTDPAAALTRWETLPADAHRDLAAVQIARNWAPADPAAATRWLATHLSKDASESPGAAALRDLQNIALPWAARDPVGFVEWSASLPDEAHRDALRQSLSGVYWKSANNRADPPPRAAYADQLSRINDPQLRENVLREHLREWMRSDRASARAWIETSGAFSPEQAASLLSERRVAL